MTRTVCALPVFGSSPRTWGTRQFWRLCRLIERFIPTHVGNTLVNVSGLLMMTVHPHARGEHLFDAAKAMDQYGSSPRTWGTHGHGYAGGQEHRFIPTHVGNTIAGQNGQSLVAVHPHARGEHHAADELLDLGHGSSPRTWGTHLC